MDAYVRQLEAMHGPAIALAEATRWGLHNHIRRLLAAGVEPDVKLENGKTPLMYAATKATAEILLKAGADPNARDDQGSTPLIWFCKGLQRKPAAKRYIQLLLDYGADPNIQDNTGHTAIDYAREKYGDDMIAEDADQFRSKG